jgi:transposase
MEEMIEVPKSEYLALKAEVEELRKALTLALKRIEDLEQENARLRNRVEELESGIGKSPPVFVRSNIKRNRRHRRGPPPGHEGKARPIVANADVEDHIELENCPHCGSTLGEPFAYTIHHVEEVVPAKVELRMHHLARYICPGCKQTITAKSNDVFPNERFGIYLMVLVCYYRIIGLTVGKIRALLKEQYGLSICDATVLKIEKRIAQEMGEHYQRLVKAIRDGKVIYIDETGWRIDGSNHWLWACASDTATIYDISRHRNGEMANDLIGTPHKGQVVSSDFYSCYVKVKATKQKCLVHLMRELKKVESMKGILHLEFMSFKKVLMRLIRDAIRLSERTLDKEVRVKRIQRLHDRLTQIYQSVWVEPHCQRLAKRLKKHKDELFTFLDHEGVKWHNNDAERAIRPMVVARKNSYGSRAIEGAKSRAVLMSVSESAKKRSSNFIEFSKMYLMQRALVIQKAE